MKKLFLFIPTLLIVFFFVGGFKENEVSWGVNFSSKHSGNLGLDWKENYLAILNDLKVKKIKPAWHWDEIEPQKNVFDFSVPDFEVWGAKVSGATLVPVIGIKTSRWPECHIPDWAKDLSKEEQQKEVLEMIEALVLRYKDYSTIDYWQVENEPFFPFGECPWTDKEFLKKEIALVKSLDSRKVMVTDTGEWSLWFTAASYGDIVGATTYRYAWYENLKTYTLPIIPAIYYGRRAWLVNLLFQKEVIGCELQMEPWGPKLLYDLSLDEQFKSMDLKRFKDNVNYARHTGLKEFYLWGAEWWYWLKGENHSEIWEEARTLFN